MSSEDIIVNKVAQSGIITIDLADFVPAVDDCVLIDIKPFLYEELILRETEFRDALKKIDWSQYQHKFVALTCTADAIVPLWAYMLLAQYLQSYAKHVIFGDLATLKNEVLLNRLQAYLEQNDFTDARAVIKGCGDKDISANIYVQITQLLLPKVKSLMYGEPCSTVPVYKKPKN